MRRLAAIFLLLALVLLGTGAAGYWHDLGHASEDAVAAAGQRRSAPPVHDQTNCRTHAQLHMPGLAAAMPPLLILLGLWVAYLTLLPRVAPEQVWAFRLACRGPPR